MSKEEDNKEQQRKPQMKKKAPDPITYEREEVLASASGLGVSRDVLAGALRLSEKERYTRAEIDEAVRLFKKREV